MNTALRQCPMFDAIVTDRKCALQNDQCLFGEFHPG